jgi:DNA-binding winged helix-turn-helix (wHTH) protein
MLSAFAGRYRRDEPAVIEQPSRRIGISLIKGTVRVGHTEIAPRGREFELLLFLALREGPVSSELLSEAMWPESDGDRAKSALKVTLSRLRTRLGDGSLIIATPTGYALTVEADIDIAPLLKRESESPPSTELPSCQQLEAARVRLSRWPWAKPYEALIRKFEAEAQR